ncbi:MAG: glycosyltransferase family 9 protein [Ferrovum sp.]|nr:glycosyltransferase family 9 protein [Ferrovum sp.]NDU88179.1 glycosyltransferase family 9 protein [Ferrovum sp.]
MNSISPDNTPEDRFLVICTLRIGDILLTTPLIHSLRQASPRSHIAVLVLSGMGGILQGNPDINEVIETPHRAPLSVRWKEWRSLWRRFTHALTPVSSDRARLYAFIAARRRIGFFNAHTSWLSRKLLTDPLLFDDESLHTVTLNLKLLEPLGFPKNGTVVSPRAGGDIPATLAQNAYAVLHPYPKFSYKSWPLDKWVALIENLNNRPIPVVLTGGNDPQEIAFVEEISRRTGAINFAGKLSLAQTADLIAHARFYLGPDTGITHIAAATETPTIALFGPTNPIKWGPWPASQTLIPPSPWVLKGNQHQGNVWLIQGEGACVPCHQEGCDHHANSLSQCLTSLEVRSVLAQIDQLLVKKDNS